MIDFNRILKLNQRVLEFISKLDVHRNCLSVNQKINQFYYMEKAEELSILASKLENALKQQEAASNNVTKLYTELYHQWRKDARWLNLKMKNTSSR